MMFGGNHCPQHKIVPVPQDVPMYISHLLVSSQSFTNVGVSGVPFHL